MDGLPDFEKNLLDVINIQAQDYNNTTAGLDKTNIGPMALEAFKKTEPLPLDDGIPPQPPANLDVEAVGGGFKVRWLTPPLLDYVSYSEIRFTRLSDNVEEVITALRSPGTDYDLDSSKFYKIEVRHIDAFARASEWEIASSSLQPLKTVAEKIDLAAAEIAGSLGWENLDPLTDPNKLGNDVITARAMATQNLAALRLWVGAAAIEDAMIGNLSADKITSGTLQVNRNLTVDGSILLGGGAIRAGVSGATEDTRLDAQGLKITPNAGGVHQPTNFNVASKINAKGGWGHYGFFDNTVPGAPDVRGAMIRVDGSTNVEGNVGLLAMTNASVAVADDRNARIFLRSAPAGSVATIDLHGRVIAPHRIEANGGITLPGKSLTLDWLRSGQLPGDIQLQYGNFRNAAPADIVQIIPLVSLREGDLPGNVKFVGNNFRGGVDNSPSVDMIPLDCLKGGQMPARVTLFNGNFNLNSINGNRIQNESIRWEQIAPNTIGGGRIEANSIRDSELANGSVGTGALKDFNVTNIKLANNSVGEGKVQANSIRINELAVAVTGASDFDGPPQNDKGVRKIGNSLGGDSRAAAAGNHSHGSGNSMDFDYLPDDTQREILAARRRVVQDASSVATMTNGQLKDYIQDLVVVAVAGLSIEIDAPDLTADERRGMKDRGEPFEDFFEWRAWTAAGGNNDVSFHHRGHKNYATAPDSIRIPAHLRGRVPHLGRESD